MSLRAFFHCDGCALDVTVVMPEGTRRPETDEDFARLRMEFKTLHEIRVHADELVTAA